MYKYADEDVECNLEIGDVVIIGGRAFMICESSHDRNPVHLTDVKTGESPSMFRTISHIDRVFYIEKHYKKKDIIMTLTL